MRKKIWLHLLALLLVFGSSWPVAEAAPAAQTGNLIVNGGFETTGGSTGAANWLPWWSEIPKPSQESFNYAYKPNWNVDSLNNNDAKANIYAGSNTQRVINNWDPWYAGVKQVVNAPAGARVRLTAYGKLWASPDDWPAPADTTVDARMFIGLDPNGTENQFASNVVWSGSIRPLGTWQSVSVEATVGSGGRVGVFLAADYRGNSRKFMASFWDEISLTVVGASSGNPPAPGATTAPQPTSAPVFLTPFTLPTPGPDGNIVYVVQPGDTLWRIAGIAGTTVDQIKAMNGLSSEIISVGQRLIIGKSAAAITPTQPPAPTAAPDAGGATAALNSTTAPPATQVASVGAATVCAMLYEDVNGNGRRDATENPVAGGQFTVVDTQTGAPVQAYTTDGVNEPHCFENLPAGAYTISAAAPTGFNATTASTTALQLETGSLSNVEFGAQPSAANGGAGTDADSRSRLRVALFGAAGIMFLLLAAGVAGFLILRQRQ